MQDQLVELIVKSYRELAETEDFELPDDLSGETQLFGDEGLLDSMGLVSFIVELEEAIEGAFGAAVSLADEKALSLKRSPYRTIGTLAQYAGEQIGSP